MRSSPRPRCPLCQSSGEILYKGLRDRLFTAPGTWGHRRCGNPDCGLVWLDPTPLGEDLSLAYKSYFTHRVQPRGGGWLATALRKAKRGYIANRFGYTRSVATGDRLLGLLPWIYPGRTVELDFSVMWLHDPPGGRLLDVGAGDGWLVEQMNALGWVAEGIDFDEKAVALAKERGLSMRVTGLLEAGFPSDVFDAVTMSHCIEHVADPLSFLDEAMRVMKRGARIAIVTPNTRSWLHRRYGPAWFHLDPPRHLALFNRTALTRAMHQVGFADIRTFTTIRDANGAWLGSRSIRAHGRHDMTARPPRGMQFLARAVQMAEAVRLQLDTDSGEDLVSLAVKP